MGESGRPGWVLGKKIPHVGIARGLSVFGESLPGREVNRATHPQRMDQRVVWVKVFCWAMGACSFQPESG